MNFPKLLCYRLRMMGPFWNPSCQNIWEKKGRLKVWDEIVNSVYPLKTRHEYNIWWWSTAKNWLIDIICSFNIGSERTEMDAFHSKIIPYKLLICHFFFMKSDRNSNSTYTVVPLYIQISLVFFLFICGWHSLTSCTVTFILMTVHRSI